MLVYRGQDILEDSARAWALLLRAASGISPASPHDDVLAFAIDFGEVEAAVADRLFPDADGVHPLADALQAAALAAGTLVVASWQRDRDAIETAAARLRAALNGVPPDALPRTIARPLSQGFACYALHPETYAVAAWAFHREVKPVRVVCLGTRGIGTTLSSVVAAALVMRGVEVELRSVKPRGEPLDRAVSLDDELSRRVAADPEAWFAVVDEGPGLDGSSFASVVRALVARGIAQERIVFFPSRAGDGARFASGATRPIWKAHRHYEASAEEAGIDVLGGSADEGFELSGGAWRHLMYASSQHWPAVQPQHEVRKVWVPSRGMLLRFVGLGRCGAAKRARAIVLAEAGLGPPPGDLRSGYLSLPFIEGGPCRPSDRRIALLDAIADHLSAIVRRFPSERTPGIDALLAMIETNASDGPDGVPAGAMAALARMRPALEGAPAAAIDGRMLPHEWLDTGGAFIKADALDHHGDPFFPGTQDAAWDLAAVRIEFRLEPQAIDYVVGRYADESGDRDVAARLPFFNAAYAAFRLGYATMAKEALDPSEEGARFERAATFYRRQLRAALAP